MQFIDLKAQYNLMKESINKRIQAVLDHGQYIMGPEVAELEKKLAEFTGSKHCIAVSSGTDALMVALMAYDIGPGDEVITTPFTFIATGEMIAILGAKPVFVDIDPKTYNLNPELIEKAITKNTKAIMPVSLYGQCADFDAINQIGKKHNIPVIEDGAQSFGASYKSKKSCNLSEIGCTSFFPSKPLGGYGDGGAIFTNNDELAVKMRRIMNHGQDVRYNHPMIGINGRLDTLQAAILLVKMEHFNQEISSREKIGKRYSEKLSGNVVTPYCESYNQHVYAQFTIQVNNRDQFLKNMSERQIPTAIHYPKPLHMQPVFAHLGLKASDFPVSEKISAKVVSLPMHPYLTVEDQDAVIKAVIESNG